jgi:hypothetical protein
MADPIPLDNDTLNASLKSIWGEYRTWAMTSRKYKSDVTKWRNIVLLLSISGAVLGTLSQQLPIWGLGTTDSLSSRGLGILSGIALGLVAFLTKEIFSPDPEGKAVRSRAAAEALKSQAYLMATRVPPYDPASTATDPFAKPDRVKKAVEHLPSVTLTPAQMLERIISAPMAIEDYVKQRVVDQIDYYTSAAITNEKKVAKGRLLSMVFGAAGVVLGIVAVRYSSAAAWVAVIGTITAAIAAQQYSGRYQFLILTYQAARQELYNLHNRWEGDRKKDPAADQKLILGAEQVITAENTAWMAEWTRQPDNP